MKIAFYKAKTKLFNKLVSWWTDGPYSHCEVIFSDGMCASSSFLDGGVRFKSINIDYLHWDIIELPNIDENAVRNWYTNNLGKKYDVLGLLSVLSPVKDDKNKYFCNESIGAAMGIRDPWRFSPNSFSVLLECMGGKWISIK